MTLESLVKSINGNPYIEIIGSIGDDNIMLWKGLLTEFPEWFFYGKVKNIELKTGLTGDPRIRVQVGDMKAFLEGLS